MKKHQIAGAIFDMDGTLLDSMSVWETVGERYLNQLGYQPTLQDRELVRTMSLSQSAVYYQQTYQIPLTVADMTAGVGKLIEEDYRSVLPLKEGAMELLSALKAQGIPMVLATATERYLAEMALKRCKIDSYFQQIFTCSEVGASKTEATIFLLSAQALQTPIAQTWVFEDSYHAAKTAKESGFCVCGVYEKAEANVAELKACSDLYVTKLSEAANSLFSK